MPLPERVTGQCCEPWICCRLGWPWENCHWRDGRRKARNCFPPSSCLLSLGGVNENHCEMLRFVSKCAEFALTGELMDLMGKLVANACQIWIWILAIYSCKCLIGKWIQNVTRGSKKMNKNSITFQADFWRVWRSRWIGGISLIFRSLFKCSIRKFEFKCIFERLLSLTFAREIQMSNLVFLNETASGRPISIRLMRLRPPSRYPSGGNVRHFPPTRH